MSAGIDIRVLGPLEVDRDGELLALGGRKQRSVLAVLVLHARTVVSPEGLADAVWDGEPPASAESTLRGYVFNLRKALEPDRASDEEPRFLRTTPNGYVLDVDDEHIDARRFERLVVSGRERRAVDDPTSAIERWTRALALWRGEALHDFAYSDFARAEASRLTELKLACTEEFLEVRLELGDEEAVVADLDAFCSAHPDRERTLALRMLALYRCGRQSEALRLYEERRRRLADELGADPSPRLREVHEQILRHDESLVARVVPEATPGKQTLTFLLGDVERSTEKLRALADDYPRVLEEHRRKLRDAFEAHGGRAVLTGGEEAFAAFDCATDAVAAAVDAQLALCADGIDDERTLPVRMGLHTGEATFTGGEFVGLAIHFAARIMAAAHGGQILASQSTRELYQAEEGAGVQLVDTGLHTLKDIPEDVHLFQVVHPELRRDFPPLRTRAGRTDNIPHRPTSFIGRESDLEAIEDALEEARVVTLTGVGGVGKTRLAQEVGSRVAPRYTDGVWFCELAPLGDPEGIAPGIAATLGVPRQPGMSARDSLIGALRQRHSLVILDNCEHMLEPVAELLEDIVHSCEETDVLATSREAIGVDGEHSRPVRSLKVTSEDRTADAIRLFEDRARSVRPDFEVHDRNAADVVDICRRVDGIPLAIELAAARVTSMSPAQIASRLEEGFHFLRSGRRAAVDRHRTLHGAIDWSYEALTETEQLLFDRLSVFSGGFTLEAAERVCGRDLPLDVADGLAGLVAKSLVNADVGGDEARYSLLETMRQYGQDRLAERGDEASRTLREHGRYFVEMVESISTAFVVVTESDLRRVVREFDNVRSAFEWAHTSGEVDLAMRLVAAAGPWTAFSTDRLEPFRWAESAASMPGAEDHELFPTILGICANGLVRRGDRRAAEELATRVLEMTDGSGDPRRTFAIGTLSLVALYEGRFEDGDRWYEELLPLLKLTNDPVSEVLALSGRALAEAYRGNHVTALRLAEEGLDIALRRNVAMHSYGYYCLGEVLAAAGDDIARAMSCLEEAVTRAEAIGQTFQAGVARVTIASLLARTGDEDGALRMFRVVLDLWRVAGHKQQQGTTIRNLIELFGQRGDDEAAVALLAASEKSATAAPTFGAQAERLGKLTDQLMARMGAESFAAAWERGRAMPDEDAVAYANAEIDRALEAAPLNRADA